MIEKVTELDLNKIIDIIESIKEEMRTEGNPQWGSTEDDYPSKNNIIDDIHHKKMIKYVEDNKIKGIVSIAKDTTREYDGLIDNSEEESYIIHRLAIPQVYRKQKIATKLIKYAEEYALKNNINLLKTSTEISNDKMNIFLRREGFVCKGNYSYDNYPGTYSYYEKELERR